MANFLEGFDSRKYNGASTKKEEKSSSPEKVSSGVKVTEHQVVIDQSYARKRMIRFAVIGGAVLSLILSGFLVISAINRVTVQNFEGKTLAEAKAWAAKNSIEVDAQYEYSTSVASDIVISQSVKPDVKISKGNIMQFVVSSGADPDEIITIPELSTMTASQIQAWIDENKLTNTKISEENSDTVASGQFIKATYRDVTADKDNFKRKDYLTIAVSKGPTVAAGDVTISELVGKTKTEAESWASTNGVNLVITTKTSQKVAVDKVISQDVDSGDTVKSGGTVNITVSGGTGIEVPSFLGVGMSEAQSAYPDFVVIVKQRYSSSVGYGMLISQSVKSGKHVLDTDNKITVTYSIGRPYLENLAGSSESELPSYFYNFVQKGANISYKVSYVDSDVSKGTIISTSKYSEYLSMSETIKVVVSNGSQTSQGTENRTNNAASSSTDDTDQTPGDTDQGNMPTVQ